jgi:hypothetical protein
MVNIRIAWCVLRREYCLLPTRMTQYSIRSTQYEYQPLNTPSQVLKPRLTEV